MYRRLVIKVSDANALQGQIEDEHPDYRFVCAIPWGAGVFLVFEKEVSPAGGVDEDLSATREAPKAMRDLPC